MIELNVTRLKFLELVPLCSFISSQRSMTIKTCQKLCG